VSTGWTETTLGALCDSKGGRIQTGPFGSSLHQSDYVDEGIPVVMPKDIVGMGIDTSSVARISVETFARLSKHKLKLDDIVFPRRGEITKCALITEEYEGFLCGTGCLKISMPKQEVLPKYFRYYLALPQSTDWLDSNAVGATMKNLSAGILEKFPLRYPPPPTQKKIAGVLSAYDDLIEVNLKRIKHLEEMAQITYEEWFVRLRFPGHETTPTNPETGLPVGWDLLPFEMLVDFKEGPGLRNWQYRESGVPFLNIRVIKDGDVDLTKVQYLDAQEVDDKYKHFLVAENDHVISSSGTLGRLVTIRNTHLPLCMNTSLIRMRKKTERIGTWHVKHMLLAKEFQHTLESYANGSAQVNFGPIHLKQIKIPAPPNEIGVAYEKTVAPIEEAIKLYRDQNALLKEARDLLLPRLMTGLIDIDEYLSRQASSMVAA
jgi:type I restriction enzyme S subunit